MSMTPTRPYFLRAMYEWILDNQCTPHLMVDATVDGVMVPEEFVEDGQIILNISPSAVVSFEMDNEFVQFNARFNGTPRQIFVPMLAVLGIYARENGHGMAFPEEDYEAPYIDDDHEPDPEPPRPSGKPSLKIVK